MNITLEDSAKWPAAGTSYVMSLDGITFSEGIPANVDAGSGVTIYYSSATDAAGTVLTSEYTLPGGGTLVKN